MENNIYFLAKSLVELSKNDDFYHYQDCLEIGDNDNDAIESMMKDLLNIDFCKELIERFLNKEYHCDDSLIEKLVQHYRTLKGGE